MTAAVDYTRWRTIRLADCVDAVSTGPFGSLLHKDDYVRDGIPVINPINLRDGRIIHSPEVTVAGALAKQLNGYRVRAGDILVARRGDIGRCGLVLPSQDGWICGTGCFVIRTGQAVDPQFLTLLIGSPIYRTALEGLSTGTTMLNLSNKALSNLEISLPPLEEQKRIVAVLDQGFVALDRARALAEANLADAEEFFDSWASDALRLKGVDRPTVYLPDISENLDRSRVPITKADRKPGNVPYYGASGEVDRVADFIFDEDLLLVSEDGANLLARTYPIAFSISGKSWVNNHAHVLRFANPTDQEYVRLYLNSIPLDDFVSGMAQPKLNQKALNSIPIPFPPGEERARIVEKAAEISAASVAAMGIYDAQLTDVAELRQSLLQKAFAGELT